MRCAQGAGGAFLLSASLPLLSGASRSGDSATARWASAAALGAAIGPAAGGILTQVFDWRAIFFAQTPVAAFAAAAVLVSRVRPRQASGIERARPKGAIGPGTANVALMLLSAGLIGALFLVVILLIDVWQLPPAAAAAVVSAIPLATVLVRRAARSGPPVALAASGAILVAVGLTIIALLPSRELGLVVLALAICGSGLGLAFTSLSAAALGGGGSATTRAGRTVAARDAGLILGLLVLTPLFVHDLNAAPGTAIPNVTAAVARAPIPSSLKGQLGNELLDAYANTSQASLPDLAPPFAHVERHASVRDQARLGDLQGQLESILQRAATHSFRNSLLFSALFALLVLPVLAVRFLHVRRRSRAPHLLAAGGRSG
jgi:MFS family permease